MNKKLLLSVSSFVLHSGVLEAGIGSFTQLLNACGPMEHSQNVQERTTIINQSALFTNAFPELIVTSKFCMSTCSSMLSILVTNTIFHPWLNINLDWQGHYLCTMSCSKILESVNCKLYLFDSDMDMHAVRGRTNRQTRLTMRSSFDIWLNC